SLAKLNVDLVVDTGDNLGHRDAIKPALAAMQGVLGIPGVFVNGSNDYFAPAPRNPFNYLFSPSKRESHEALATAEFIEGLETAGWLNLNNSTGTLSVNGSKLRFVGVDDHHEHLSKLETIGQNAKALKTGETLIGVTHAPYLAVINAMEDAGVQVLFAGHTHGGQVCIPGFGAIITNCDLPANAAKGLSSWSRTGRVMWLNVCAGLGHSIYAPVRFACKPEVRIIELVAAE
ncbi:MAG: hypothetical protein RL556_654, partial [Actinomycetota bacterium]